jgi:hypothetical protein
MSLSSAKAAKAAHYTGHAAARPQPAAKTEKSKSIPTGEA